MKRRIATATLKPRQGRRNLACGVSRGSRVPSLPPPPPGGGGGQKGGGGHFPQGFRPGLRSYAPNGAGATYITNHWDRRLVSLSMQSHLATVNFSFSNHSSVFKVSRWNWKDGKRWNVRECLFFVPWNQKVAEGARRYEGGKCGKINHICAFSHIVPQPRGGSTVSAFLTVGSSL